MATLRLECATIHGEWNYTILAHAAKVEMVIY